MAPKTKKEKVDVHTTSVKVNARDALDILKKIHGIPANSDHNGKKNQKRRITKYLAKLINVPARVQERLFIAALRRKYRRLCNVQIRNQFALIYFANKADLQWALQNNVFVYNSIEMTLIAFDKMGDDKDANKGSGGAEGLGGSKEAAKDINKGSGGAEGFGGPEGAAGSPMQT